jgi:oligopeptide/dipeptide ABC transporter ATP-binding protein
VVRKAERTGRGAVNRSQCSGATHLPAAARDVGAALWVAGRVCRSDTRRARDAAGRGDTASGMAGEYWSWPLRRAYPPSPTRHQSNPFGVAMAALFRASHSFDFWLLALSFAICGLSTNDRRRGPIYRCAAVASRSEAREAEYHRRGPECARSPSGCRFHPRCPHAMPHCAREAPVRKEVAPRHTVTCHLY